MQTGRCAGSALLRTTTCQSRAPDHLLGSLPTTATAEAAATPTTGRGTRRGRDEDAPPVVARDTSGLDGLPAPQDSKDASGKPYDSAASWVDDRLEKVKALLKKLQQQEQVTPKPSPTPP